MTDIGSYMPKRRKGGVGGDTTKNTNRKSARYGQDYYTEPTRGGTIHHYANGPSVFVPSSRSSMGSGSTGPAAEGVPKASVRQAQGARLNDLLAALRAKPPHPKGRVR